jgi:hypothetical protein
VVSTTAKGAIPIVRRALPLYTHSKGAAEARVASPAAIVALSRTGAACFVASPHTIQVSGKEIQALVGATPPALPTYVAQILNLANSNAGGTRPRVVGQMTELIREADPRSYEDWEAWYRKHHDGKIEAAVDRILAQLEKHRRADAAITRELVLAWVEDLVLAKTYAGLKAQDAILVLVAARYAGGDYTQATAADEARGIDGYVGGQAVQIKPGTYKRQAHLPEKILVPVIYYEKDGSEYAIDCSEFARALGL